MQDPLRPIIPRGQMICTQPDVSEAKRYQRCPLCRGYIDVLDYASVLDHEDTLPHPALDQVQ